MATNRTATEVAAKRCALVLATTALLVSCAGADLQRPMPAQIAAIESDHTFGRLGFRIRIPASSRRNGAKPRYVSAATKAMLLVLKGPTKREQTVGLTAKSPNCETSAVGRICTVSMLMRACPSTYNCYSLTLTTYDAYNASTNRIPKDANILSSGQTYFTIVAAQATVINLTLDGIAESVALAASMAKHSPRAKPFVAQKCPPEQVTAYGVDADGYLISGAGAPAIKVTAGPGSEITVTPASPASNTYTLSYPITSSRQGPIPLSASIGDASFTTNVTLAGGSNVCGIASSVESAYGERPNEVTVGPDRALWYTAYYGNGEVGRLDMGTLTATDYNLQLDSGPEGITAGPDGALWFTDTSLGDIDRIATDASSGSTVTRYPLAAHYCGPFGIATGADGALWFTEQNCDRIGRITTSGSITEYGPLTAGSEVSGIISGPDHALWFAEECANKIGRITTMGSISEYQIPTKNAGVSFITSADGALWFSETNADKIGSITTAGSITEYIITGSSSSSRIEPGPVIAGPDNALWFASIDHKNVWRMSLARNRAFTTYSTYPEGNFGLPAPGTLGPDGALWFPSARGFTRVQ